MSGSYRLSVDWNGDGDFADTGEDITAYVRTVEWGRGRDYASQLTGRSSAGSLVAQLNNMDGRFNSFLTTGPLYGNILPGRAVKLESTAPVAATLWYGFLDSVQPQPALGGVHTAELRATGPLAWINQRSASVAMRTSILTGTAIGYVLDDAGWSASARTIATGQTTMTRWSTDKNALAALRDIEASEPGFIREGADGKIVFEDRFTRLLAPYTTSQATFSDAVSPGYSGIVQQDPMKEIFNVVSCQVQLYSVGTLAVLWTLALTGSSSPSIDAGASADFWAGYPNPASVINADSVDAWTTPVATTDYLANSAADGSGSNLTGSVSVAVSKFSTSMKITLTNAAGVPAYITFLQARGTPVTLADPLTVLTEDSTSEGKYGKRNFPLSGPFVPDFLTADSFTRFLLSVYKDPIPVLAITVPADKDTNHLTQAQSREISDRITIVANGGAGLGINGDFYIESMRHTLTEAGTIHTVTYECSPASAYSGFWIMDLSTLDTTTKLAY